MQAWHITHLSYHIIIEVNLNFFNEGKKCNTKIEKYRDRKTNKHTFQKSS